RYVPRVLAVTEPATADHAAGAIVGQRLAALIETEKPSYLLAGSGPEGRDVAGVLSALTGWGVLVNAVGVAWDDGPVVSMSIFGGKLTTTSRLTADHGIVTVRPNAVTVEAAGVAAPIEEARIIVAGGRGVGGPDGFNVVEELAEALGGAVGATRAAVDSGWIPYAQQIG